MRNYTHRLVIIIFPLLFGAATIYLLFFSVLETLIPTQIAPSHRRVVHSSGNNRPYSLLEGKTVRIEPYDATFDIPESWLVPRAEKNLYLNWQELNEINRLDGIANGFDVEDAQVINSALAFEDCAAHIGDKNWDNGLWNDLQVRVYVINLKPEEIAESIEKKGLAKAVRLFENASLSSTKFGKWQKQRLKILDAPTHFVLNKNIDFYYQLFDNKVVVFVFIRAYGFDETVDQMLNSFKWK